MTAATASTASGETSARTIRVVLVDDHDLVADSLSLVLSTAEDVSVVGCAGSCAAGLALVAHHRPDVVLLDQSLPDGNGTELVPRLHAASPGTAVVLVTASDAEDVLVRAVQVGCAGFVPKGRSVAELLEAVRTVAAGEAAISSDALRRLVPRLVGRDRRLGSDLTPRELEVLHLLVEGGNNASIAGRLFISHMTARNHVHSVMAKLGAHSRLEAVAIALRERLVAPPS